MILECILIKKVGLFQNITFKNERIKNSKKSKWQVGKVIPPGIKHIKLLCVRQQFSVRCRGGNTERDLFHSTVVKMLEQNIWVISKQSA